MRAVVPHAVEVIYMIVAGLMGLLLLALGALGLWRVVQPRRLTLSQRLLVMPVSLLLFVMGSGVMLVSVDQEALAKMLALPLFLSMGLTLAIGGPWLAVRSETPVMTRIYAVIATPFGFWILISTAAAIISPTP